MLAKLLKNVSERVRATLVSDESPTRVNVIWTLKWDDTGMRATCQAQKELKYVEPCRNRKR